MDNSQANNRGGSRGPRGGNPRGPRGGGRPGGNRGGNSRGHPSGHQYRGQGGGGRGRGRGGKSNHPPAGNDAGSPSHGHQGSGQKIKAEPVDQSSNSASAQQPVSANPDTGKKRNNRPKGGNGIAGRYMKRKEEFDAQEAEKKRRFDSGEVLPDIKDEYDFESFPASTVGAGSTSNTGGESRSGVDGKSTLVNPFADPDDSGAEDAEMADDDADEEADKVKAYLCNMLRRAMKLCLQDGQQAWQDFDQRMHLFGKFATSGDDQGFLTQLKSLRDGAQTLLRGKAAPLDAETEGKKATLGCSITSLTPDNMRGAMGNAPDAIADLRKAAANEAASFNAEVQKRVAVPKDKNIPAFQKACATNIGLWTQDIAHFSDVKKEYRQSLQAMLTFSNGLTLALAKQGQPALTKCMEIDCIIKNAPTKGALDGPFQTAKEQAEAECKKMPRRWVELMVAFKRKYFKLWSVPALTKMDKDTFLKTWEHAHTLLIDSLDIPTDSGASSFFLPEQLPHDVDMPEADLTTRPEYEDMFTGPEWARTAAP